MDLRDKFDSYQTEVDSEAWEHFQLLRNNQQPKRRFFWWFFFGGLMLIGTVGLFLWTSNKNTIDSREQLGNIINDSTTIINRNEQNEITSIDKNVAIPTKHDTVSATLSKASKNLPSDDLNNRHTAIVKIDLAKNANTQKETTIQSTLENSANQNNTTLLKEGQLSKNTIENKQAKTTANKATNNRKADIVANIESPINKLLMIPDSTEKLDIPPPSLIKPIKSKKNTLKFGVNFADAYVNGFSLENSVNKQGLALQLEYYHEWNKIIATGISAGYVNMVDQKNPSVAIKGQETIKFLHANLYLFLLNENKHRLYAKVGAGLTNTDRVLGTFLVKANGDVERTFQINNLTDIGFLVEGAYEYKLNKSFIIGANYSIISHNDGGWYTGLSIGYQF